MSDKKMLARLLLFYAVVIIVMAIRVNEVMADQWGMQLSAGTTTHDIQKLDLGIVWDPNKSWWDTGLWHFSLVGEGHLAFWHNAAHDSLHSNIVEAGITPVFLFERNWGAIRPYIEAGIGVRLISHPRISADYTMSSAFQFADMIGIGAKLGRCQRYQAGLRFQHLSNAGLKRPNPGINFYQILVQRNF